MKIDIIKYLDKSIECSRALKQYEDMLSHIANILRTSSIIWIAGNGGSASTASHMASDFNRIGLNAICLTDNISALTAWANDDCYENVFIRLLSNDSNLVYDDVILILSGSGNSENLVRLAKWGRENKKYVIAFLGTNGGRLNKMKDILKIHIDNDQHHTEDWHLLLDHLLCEIIKGDK